MSTRFEADLKYMCYIIVIPFMFNRPATIRLKMFIAIKIEDNEVDHLDLNLLASHRAFCMQYRKDMNQGLFGAYTATFQVTEAY